jgi:hypothetical protein
MSQLFYDLDATYYTLVTEEELELDTNQYIHMGDAPAKPLQLDANMYISEVTT